MEGVEDLYNWVKEALFGALDLGRGRFVMAGNLISKNSVLQKMTESDGVDVIQVNAVDEKGEPVWKDKWTKEEAKAAADFMGYYAWNKEYMHNPIVAGKWERIEKDGDEYLLQYRTAGDDKVRPEHASLYGITLPPSDTFWDEYYPPNGWNCRCSVAQVRRDKFPQTDREEAFTRARKALAKDKKGMFRFNPGKQECTVPAYNPYTISKCKNCPKAKNLAAGISANQLCEACAFIQKCVVIKEETVNYGKGTISVNKGVNPNDSDYDKLYSIAQFFAKNGSEVHLTPKMSRPEKFKYECIYSSLVDTKYEGKCPDLLIDGKWYEHEGFVTTNPKNAFRNMLRDGLRQSCRLIIDRPELTMRYMTRSIYNRLKKGEVIEEVWLLNKDGSIDLLYKKTDG